MKKIILLALVTLTMAGCKHKTDAEIEEAKSLSGFNIVVIDSCEYLKRREPDAYGGYGYFAHKGNCRFCAERRQQELETFVKQIKEKKHLSNR